MLNICKCGFLAAVLVAIHSYAADTNDTVKQVESILPPHIGACVLAVNHGEVVFKHAYGIPSLESRALCTTATNFRIASVSKQFTATGTMLLVDRGQLKLNDPLTKFFPGFPEYGKRITVKHLLTHTSGLPAYEDLIPPGTTLQLDDYDVLHLLMDTHKPLFPAGERFEYSNSGYTMLGLIIEIVAQKPLHTFMADEIFSPLKMDGSVVYQRGLNEVQNRAFGHIRQGHSWVVSDQSLTSAVRGDGGVYTSVDDYLKWLRGIDDQKLLTKSSYKAMFSPQVLTNRNQSHYGFGWFIDEYRGEPRIYHGGETHGFRACIERFPNREAAVFFQMNAEIEGQSDKLIAIGERLADAIIFDAPKK